MEEEFCFFEAYYIKNKIDMRLNHLSILALTGSLSKYADHRQKTFHFNGVFLLLLTFFLMVPKWRLHAQAPNSIPIPVEVFFGHDRMGFQMVVKKQFTPESRFGFFSVATFAASYDNDFSDHELTIPAQLNYTLGKGFGIMMGMTLSSKAGLSPVTGLQHSFANRKILAVSTASIGLNKDHNLQLFGLYEFKPPINEQWSVYTKLQLLYILGLESGTHERSYLNLRAGFKYNAFAFGLGSNLDQYGPMKVYRDNYGVFLHWEFY